MLNVAGVVRLKVGVHFVPPTREALPASTVRKAAHVLDLPLGGVPDSCSNRAISPGN
jgi:hypothetical protein